MRESHSGRECNEVWGAPCSSYLDYSPHLGRIHSQLAISWPLLLFPAEAHGRQRLDGRRGLQEAAPAHPPGGDLCMANEVWGSLPLTFVFRMSQLGLVRQHLLSESSGVSDADEVCWVKTASSIKGCSR